jgi:hypothetical protein
MTEKERKEFLSILEEYKTRLSKNEKKAKEFLVDVGVYTEKGNLSKNYKHLCIQQEVA